MDAVNGTDAVWDAVSDLISACGCGCCGSSKDMEKAKDAIRAALDAMLNDERLSASLDRENLNAQLDDWRERALRCEKLRRDIVPMGPK